MIEVRYGIGENATHFITPDNPDVIAYKDYIISSDGVLSWEDMDTIFDWIWWNTHYNYDTYVNVDNGYFFGEFWQYPNETLSNMDEWGYSLGDCEDFAVLMASLCKAEENVDWLWCAELTLVDDGIEYGHACIFIDVAGDKMYIYDPTWNWTSRTSKPEQNALAQYISENGFDSVTVNAIFNEDVYIPFNNNQEFFDFF